LDSAGISATTLKVTFESDAAVAVSAERTAKTSIEKLSKSADQSSRRYHARMRFVNQARLWLKRRDYISYWIFINWDFVEVSARACALGFQHIGYIRDAGEHAAELCEVANLHHKS
jgi:hypothetical protein